MEAKTEQMTIEESSETASIEGPTGPEQVITSELVQATAVAYPPDKVLTPVIPAVVHMAEGFATVESAREHTEALQEVGMGARMPDFLEACLEEFRSVQAVVHGQKRGRSPKTEALLVKARELRTDAIGACDLAMFATPDKQEQVAGLRAGRPGPSELPLVLVQLAMIVRKHKTLLATVRFKAEPRAIEMEQIADGLQHAIAQDDAAAAAQKLLDLRNRLYTITALQVARIRAYAAYAFRHDATERRRQAFSSDFWRARNRAAKRRREEQEQSTQPTETEVDGATAPTSEPPAESTDSLLKVA